MAKLGIKAPAPAKAAAEAAAPGAAPAAEMAALTVKEEEDLGAPSSRS
jgi:hypothetical protein